MFVTDKNLNCRRFSFSAYTTKKTKIATAARNTHNSKC